MEADSNVISAAGLFAALSSTSQQELFDESELPRGHELLMEVGEQRKRFTAELVARNQERYQAIVAALSEGLSVRTICRAFKVSHHTVFTIRDREASLVATGKQEMARRMMNVAKMATERMEEAIANNEIAPSQLAVVTGILVDKSLLLAGEATARVEVRRDLSQDEVRRMFEELSQPIEVEVLTSPPDSQSGDNPL